jgi:hypothetical protein
MTGHACFSYSAEVPLGDRPGTPGGKGYPCFSYSGEAPLGVRDRGAAQRALHDLPKMPTTSHCFSYSARRAPRDLRRMPRTGGACFAYSDGMPPGDRPRLPEGRLCFSY